MWWQNTFIYLSFCEIFFQAKLVLNTQNKAKTQETNKQTNKKTRGCWFSAFDLTFWLFFWKERKRLVLFTYYNNTQNKKNIWLTCFSSFVRNLFWIWSYFFYKVLVSFPVICRFLCPWARELALWKMMLIFWLERLVLRWCELLFV
jgi:hypothetical protein